MDNISSDATEAGVYSVVEPSVTFLVASYSIAIIGFVLNFIEIYLITRVWSHATDFELLLFNLAVADALNCVLFAVVTGTLHCMLSNRLSSAAYMFLVLVFNAFSIIASTSFVIVIGVERFFAAKLPLKHRLWHTSRRKLLVCISVTWGFDVIVSATLALINYFAIGESVMLASTELTYFVAALFTAGLVLVAALYAWLAKMILMRSMKLFDFDSKDLSVNAKSIKRAMKKERATVLVCALVVVSLFICDLPIIVDVYLKRLTQITVLLLKLNSIANPVIYFFKGYFEKHYAKKILVPSSVVRGSSHDTGSNVRMMENVA